MYKPTLFTGRKIKVIITGGYGVVGRLLYEALANDEHYDIYLLDKSNNTSARLSLDKYPTNDWKLPQIDPAKFIQCDITQYENVLAAIKGMDIVVHLAAALENLPVEVIHKTNVLGTENIFKACEAMGVKKIVYASSIMTMWSYLAVEPYKSIFQGNTENVVLNDKTILSVDKPTSGDEEAIKQVSPQDYQQYSAYIQAKLANERVAKEFAAKPGRSVIGMRLGWVNTNDTPYSEGKDNPEASIWLSQHDAGSFMRKCVEACINNDNLCKIYFGISNNRYCWVDTATAKRELNWHPQDCAEDKKIILSAKNISV